MPTLLAVHARESMVRTSAVYLIQLIKKLLPSLPHQV